MKKFIFILFVVFIVNFSLFAQGNRTRFGRGLTVTEKLEISTIAKDSTGWERSTVHADVLLRNKTDGVTLGGTSTGELFIVQRIDDTAIKVTGSNSEGTVSMQMNDSGIGFVGTTTSDPFVVMQGEGQVLRIDNNKNVLYRTSASPTGTMGYVFVFSDNTGDPTMSSNTAGIYAKDVSGTVEVFTIDEAGNATQQTTHDKDGKFIHFTSNNNEGWAEFIDFNGLIEELEKLSGKKFKIRRNFKNPGSKRDLLKKMLEHENR